MKNEPLNKLNLSTLRRYLISITRLYTDLNLKNKYFVMSMLIVSLVCMVSQIAIKSVLSIYDNILYDEAAQVLNVSTTMIESEFKRIDGISFNIVSDSKVQEYVAQIKNGPADYERFRAITQLVDKIFSYVSSEKSVSSIHFFDTNGNQFYQGNYVLRMKDDAKSLITSKAIAEEGNNVIIGPINDDPSVIFAREIRAVPGLSLDYMGALVIRINMERLINKYMSSIPKGGFDFLIFSDEKPIYISNTINNNETSLSSILNSKTDSIKSVSELLPKFKNNNGYIFENINNKKFFIAYTRSEYTGWIYVNAIPYDAIFERITDMSRILLIVFSAVFFLTLLISMLFSRNITKPLEDLTKKMKNVEKGNFELCNEQNNKHQRADEIGQLNNDFDIMICKINALIKEDYTKQIIIKDAQFKALQAQINPHFLYNTLDSINWMAKLSRENNISLMVESLGNMLRSTISNKEHVITLGYETEILISYINIQKIRYENRLDFMIDIDNKYNSVKIPKLTLQPIVENSINYGLENMVEECRITVSAEEYTDGLEITIKDNGPGIEEGLLQKLERGLVSPKGFGIGLKNIDDRIKIIFGEGYGIRINSKEGHGTSVHICIPIEMGDFNV